MSERTNERSGAHEQSEQCGASERVSAGERAIEASRAEQAQRVNGASERANGRASGPVLQSVFLVVLAHSVMVALLDK